MRMSEAELATLLKRGTVQEVGRERISAGRHEPTMKHGVVRHLSPATRRQKQASLAARVALVAWRATLAALPPVIALCGACQKTTQHRCTPWGWACGGCGVERIREEFEGTPVCLAGPLT